MCRPRRPLAEDLYREVHRVLKKNKTYRRTVAAFLRGHGIRIGSSSKAFGKALSKVRKAVKQLQGVPLRNNRYKLKIRLDKNKRGARIIVASRGKFHPSDPPRNRLVFSEA